MKKQTLKLSVTIICVLAAGICYSCGRWTDRGTDSRHLTEFSEESFFFETQSDECLEYSDAADSELETDTEPAVSFTEDGICYVHVCGEVKKPGVYEIAPGSRVFQAVEQAGGFTEAAAKGYLNLAQEIVDGMKIIVPSREWEDTWNCWETDSSGQPAGRQEPLEATVPGIYVPSEGTGFSTFAQGAQEGKVNLNSASKDQLMTLKGIGQARAQDIIRYRDDHGPFQSIEEIMNVSGIKENAFNKIKDDITV